MPPYGDKGLSAENLQPVRQALDFILRQQEPYPAIVIDGHWDVRIRNQASARLFKPFFDSYQMEKTLADNAMHAVFHPKGLRQFMLNWDEFARQLIQILHRDVAQGSRAATQLLDEIMALDRYLESLRNTFFVADADIDGQITQRDIDLHTVMEGIQVRTNAINMVMRYDLDGDGFVTEDEVRRGMSYDRRAQLGLAAFNKLNKPQLPGPDAVAKQIDDMPRLDEHLRRPKAKGASA